jgi:hypothetical protein
MNHPKRKETPTPSFDVTLNMRTPLLDKKGQKPILIVANSRQKATTQDFKSNASLKLLD